MSSGFWHRKAAPELPRLQGDIRCDVCVVGLGGSGLAAVQEAVSRGLSVVGLDARGVASGAAGRNGGFLLAGPAWFHHDARARFGASIASELYAHTLAGLTRIFEEPGGVAVRTGSLRVAVDEAEREDCRAHRAALEADGFAADWYSGAEGEGLLLASDGVFDPVARCAGMARRALDAGAHLFQDSPARRIEPGVVVTPTGTVRCSSVLVMVDGALPQVFPELASEVRQWRLQMLATAPVARRLSKYAVYRRYGYDYWQQRPDGTVLLGGGRDVGGEGEATASESPSDVVQGYLDGVIAQIAGRVTVVDRWSGIVSYTHDGLPLVRELRPGVWVAGAYCGTGNIIGTLCGEAIVRRLTGDRAAFLDVIESARALDA